MSLASVATNGGGGNRTRERFPPLPVGDAPAPRRLWVLAAALGGSHAERKRADDEVSFQRSNRRRQKASIVRLHVPCTTMHSSSTRGGALHIDKDLVAASATPLVLAILAEDESYGYAILKRVRALSGGELEWTDGMLYPLLHRLGRLGYVTTEWRTSPEGRRRKYYAITDDGRAALANQQRQWLAVTRALNDVWPRSGAVLTTLGEA